MMLRFNRKIAGSSGDKIRVPAINAWILPNRVTPEKLLFSITLLVYLTKGFEYGNSIYFPCIRINFISLSYTAIQM